MFLNLLDQKYKNFNKIINQYYIFNHISNVIKLFVECVMQHFINDETAIVVHLLLKYLTKSLRESYITLISHSMFTVKNIYVHYLFFINYFKFSLICFLNNCNCFSSC